MKKIFRLLSLALCLASNFAGAADLRIENPQLHAELRDTTFVPLFEAIHTGDVATIKHYMSSSMYAQYRVLLNKTRGMAISLETITPESRLNWVKYYRQAMAIMPTF